MLRPIPFVLITGFLGSGKTTLVRRILDETVADRKIALIQNEFAPSNIDGEEIMRSTGDRFELLEVNNGSVFCVCLLGSFADSLVGFVDMHQPDLVVMEASGLSDPAGIAELFQSDQLRSRVFFSEAWCVVDAAHFGKIEKMNTRYRHQVQIADRVIVNKTDRVSTEISENVLQRVREINPFCKVDLSTYCRLDVHQLLLNFKDLTHELSSRMPVSQSEGRPDIQSGVIKLGIRLETSAMESFLRDNADRLIRVKGFFTTPAGEGYAVHFVHGDIRFEMIGNYQGNLHLIFMGSEIQRSGLGQRLKTLAN